MAADLSRLFLTGLSGTGKSSLAPLVAEALGWRAIDVDVLVEQDAGCAIAEIFARDGEPRFRELEVLALQRVAREENAVIATGGGALLSAKNRRLIGERGFLICLDAPPEALFARLQSEGSPVSERPLLAGPDPLDRLTELKASRAKFYALADATIETEGRALGDVAGEIVGLARHSDPWFAAHPERLLLPEERRDPPLDGPVSVEAPSRRYPVHVAWGALDSIGERLREGGLDGAAWVVSDDAVLPRHGERLLLSLREAGFTTDALAVPAGEASKSLDTAAIIYDWLASRKAERGHAIIALGGGVVGDLAGFVAATYLRGVPSVQAPTSLLAMVDAAIGGKVAVDLRAGKNLVGAFYQPWLVVEDISTLKTLPRRALIEGCAEIIKQALIFDPDLLADLEDQTEDLLHVEPAFTVDIVRRNVALKGAMVAKDELDKGPRNVLNYGHTIGHAIEAAAGYEGILHGEAVSIGMMAAAEIGRRMEITHPELVERQGALLERFGLPTHRPDAWPHLDVDAVLAPVTLDKKVTQGSVRWVLLEDVGRTVFRSGVPVDLVREVVRELLS